MFMFSATSGRRKNLRLVPILLSSVAALVMCVPTAVLAAGYEVPENTTLSVARGGTGVAIKDDPSALYFNPALLARARGIQTLFNVNFLDSTLEFQRDDLIYQRGSRTIVKEFDPVSDSGGIQPVPFVTASWDLGIEDFAMGLGIMGPHAYGTRCYGESAPDGACNLSPNATRNLLVESNLLAFYISLGAGYQFDLWGGKMSIGATAMAAHQRINVSVAAEAAMPIGSPWEEDPEREAFFRLNNLQGWAPTGVLGIGYAKDGMRLGASYKPSIRWQARGPGEVDFPEDLAAFGAQLSDGDFTLHVPQAGWVRFGWGYEGGVHPGRANRPLYDIEFNIVWENWSIVDFFKLEPPGGVNLTELDDSPDVPLYPVYQPKHYRDTFSLRMGGSYGALPWLTVHSGGFFETPAQTSSATNVDFVSWERYAGSLGATFHFGYGLDLSLAYSFVHSPNRRVSSGRVYNQIPMSQCTGPDYSDAACEVPGTPPGNPQNNGLWSSYNQIASIGVIWTH